MRHPPVRNSASGTVGEAGVLQRPTWAHRGVVYPGGRALPRPTVGRAVCMRCSRDGEPRHLPAHSRITGQLTELWRVRNDIEAAARHGNPINSAGSRCPHERFPLLARQNKRLQSATSSTPATTPLDGDVQC